MAVSLFPHNQTAYRAVTAMLAETGKAAVIHPTGTGKSFIAFQLAADRPEQQILWLAPSDYIFRTQLENWRSAGGTELGNISFLTYARLMLLSSDELAALGAPGLIVLDEFHRCGAEQWGAGVRRLLARCPKTPTLGLSATSIRYLDNQRDMADELFDGHIASEMTLGEAIVRGILNPPKYVLSVYRYQNNLGRYEARVRNTKSRAARDAAEDILERLKRALDNADGLDLIFDRHMTDRTGKYLVFCANAEHMRDMIANVPDWFCRVDPHPHVYSAYSADPATEQAFADFKADCSDHLKLLFCIDMLNEGIHVPDVSGVILLRPTVSPIVYKQQIGRALSANKTTEPVIFDIVLNIENLYSVSGIQEEMEVAMTYYRDLGLENAVIHEGFELVDEVHDCLALFDRLNNTLTASWDLMYEQAEKYYQEYGDLNVPKRYATAEGYSLGQWLDTQRRVRSGRVKGILTPAQIRLLDRLHMRWESSTDVSWERYYAAAREYRDQFGDLLPKTQYVTPEGVPLGTWLSNLRTWRKGGVRVAYLSPERIAALDALGMAWDVPDYLFERNYAAAVAYHRQHGDLNVPVAYVTPDGLRLGAWLGNLRQHRRRGESALTEEQIHRLDVLGMQWGSKFDSSWDEAYAETERYYARHGDLNIPVAYVTDTGLRLGRWIRRQRDARKKGTLSPERSARLEALTASWAISA